MSKKNPDLNPFTVAEVQTIINGSIDAIISNKDYFYHSGVAVNYSHLTKEGEVMLVKTMNSLLPLLDDAKSRELDERAKAITWNSLQEQHDQ
jgi:hypothetical protein